MLTFLMDVFFGALEFALFIVLGCWLVKAIFGVFGSTARTVNKTVDSIKGGVEKTKSSFRSE